MNAMTKVNLLTRHPEKPMIDDPTILEAHRLIKFTVMSMANFFGVKNAKENVLFSFGMTATHYQLRIKFINTHKVLKILAPFDGGDEFEYELLYKTRNVIKDIEQFYITEASHTAKKSLLATIVPSVVMWGITFTRQRTKSDVLKAPVVEISRMEENDVFDDNHLYYGLISQYTILHELENGMVEIMLELDNGFGYAIQVPKHRVPTIKRNRVFVQNAQQEMNFLAILTFQHHAVLTPEQLNRLSEHSKVVVSKNDFQVDDHFHNED